MEAAEEIVRQLRLRDIGGIIVIDFIDMVLESNRDLVLRRLTECLGRDRTKHQVAEVTSLGLVQMTRKRVGQGLLEVFSEPCEHCRGRGVIVSTDPVDEKRRGGGSGGGNGAGNGGGNAAGGNGGGNNRRDRSGPSRDATDGGRDAGAAHPEETATAEPVAEDEPAEGTRTGGRRNRGRRNRGQSGEDRAAEDAAVLAGVQTDVEPDTELHGTVEPEPEPTTEATGDGVDELPPAVSDAAEIVPALAATPPSGDGQTAEEAPPVGTAGAGPTAADEQPTEAPTEAPAEAPAAARPRRRRAASRPAGPPVS
jgi:ribonuclease E